MSKIEILNIFTPTLIWKFQFNSLIGNLKKIHSELFCLLVALLLLRNRQHYCRCVSKRFSKSKQSSWISEVTENDGLKCDGGVFGERRRRRRRAPVSRWNCSAQTEEAARQAGRGRGCRRRHGGEMHHLSVDTGGGGGCQVMVAPVGVCRSHFSACDNTTESRSWMAGAAVFFIMSLEVCFYP